MNPQTDKHIISIMNPNYPWTVNLLFSRTDRSKNVVRTSLKRLEKRGLVERFVPDDELTFRTGKKWRLTKEGIKLRKDLLS